MKEVTVMSRSREGSLIRDTKTMFIRSTKLALRSPDAIVMSTLVPAILMVVFVYVFGGAMNVGDFSVVNFIVPGIILQCIGQVAPTIAVGINNDMSKGIVDRFRTMPIAKSSLLFGSVLAAILRNIITVTIVIISALIVGFRPQAGLTQWLIAAGIIVLYITMISWLGVVSGIFSKDPESASGLMMLVGVLPFISSGFVPTETMPRALRLFAENQPMTPVIDSVRALLLDLPLPDNTLLLALMWCVGLSIVFYVMALRLYNRRGRR